MNRNDSLIEKIKLFDESITPEKAREYLTTNFPDLWDVNGNLTYEAGGKPRTESEACDWFHRYYDEYDRLQKSITDFDVLTKEAIELSKKWTDVAYIVVGERSNV